MALKNNELIYLQVVPKDPYFLWQIEVQIVAFRRFQLSSQMAILVWYRQQEELSPWIALSAKYPEANFYFYKDEGVDLGLYISQLRPHTLKKWFKEYEDFLKGAKFFYHDSDIMFNYLPPMLTLAADDICWQSDTSGYLDYTYLRNKEKQGNIPEHEAIKLLADIGGVTVENIKSYDKNTGGAQVFLKNIDYKFWEDVEDQVIKIRKAFYYGVEGSINKRYFKSESEGFQSWCADMWALNFALWKRGLKTQVTSQLDFSWATDSYDTYLKKPIYHNAGATGTQPGVFYKGAWINKSPLGLALNVSNKTAGWEYVKLIESIK